jgi:hypothetical protein
MRHFAKLLLLAFCVCSFQNTFAQEKFTVSGSIKEASTGEDLIGASITSVGTNQGTITNTYGFYSLTLKEGEYNISYSFIGYKTITKKILLNQDFRIDIELEEESEEIEAVVLSDDKLDKNVKSTEISTVKLSSKTIKKVPVVMGEVDPIKTLMLLPGVSTAREGASGFNVRGGSADQNLILLDESTIFNSSHLFGFFSVFNNDAVKDLTLYKGGIPARFGGRLSSVLDVHQKDGNSKEFHGTGGIGLISGRLMLEGPFIEKEKGSFMIAGRRSWADLFFPFATNDAVKNSTLYFYDLNVKGSYRISDKDKLYLSGYLGRDVFGFDDRFGSSWGNTTLNLRWNHLFNDRLFSNFSLIHSDFDYELEILPPGQEFRWTSHIINNSFKADFSYYLNNNNTIRFGATATDYNFEPGKIRSIKGSSFSNFELDDKFAKEVSTYISNEQKIGLRWSLAYGLRLEGFMRTGNQDLYTYRNDEPIYWDEDLRKYVARDPLTDANGEYIKEHYGSNEVIKSFWNFEPRLRVRYELNDVSSMKFSYNRTTQNLHLLSNASSPTPLDIWVPSGKYIDPERADQWSIGYFRNFMDNQYEFSVETFYKDIFDLIDYKDLPELQLNNHIETEILPGEGRAYGLELYLKKMQGRFTGWISYTLSRSERRVTGFGGEGETGINNGDWYLSAYDKTHDLSITGMYDINDKWSVSANFVLSSGIPTNYPESSFDLEGNTYAHYNGERNAERIPLYHRLDLSAILKGKERKLYSSEWAFSIYNAYNRDNASSVYFQYNEETGVNEATQLTYFKIIPSVTWNFKF